jgi:hypothetical protein
VSDRLNDVDLLGEPRSCRRLPAYVWLVGLVVLVVGCSVAIGWKALS